VSQGTVSSNLTPSAIESLLSGRKRITANDVGVTASWVRIPYSLPWVREPKDGYWSFKPTYVGSSPTALAKGPKYYGCIRRS